MSSRVHKSSVSAVMVSYFTGPLLARSIAALRLSPEVIEIIVVDNGNWDGAVESAIGDDNDGAPVEIVRGQGNVGFAAGCNLGAKRARGEHLLFVNPDAVLPHGAVGQLLAAAPQDGRPWLIAPLLVDPDGAEQRGSRRATLTPWRAFVEATGLYRIAPRHPYFRRFNLHGDPRPEKVTPVPTISGACFMLPRCDFEMIGGMDELYFLHVEDVDFCLRFGKAGGQVLIDPNVSVVHHKSSSRANPLRIEMMKAASMNRYFRRHFDDVYPPGFLHLVAACLWTLFAFKVVARAPAGMFRRLSNFARLGVAGDRRARAIAARRRDR